MLRRAIAAALVAGALAPAGASADPLPDPPPVHTFCEVYWLPVPAPWATPP